jgi:hypothetical protein
MEDGTKFAIAVLAIFGSMVCFYFAFHPGGVQGVANPKDALSWIIKQFQTTAGVSNSG